MADPTTLSCIFKEQYADSIVNAIPDGIKIQKDVDFVQSDKEEGNNYNQPVVLQQENAFAFAAAGAGAFAVTAASSALSMSVKNAAVQGANVLLESSLSYDAAAKSTTNKKAFMKGMDLLVENMLESARGRIESLDLYGQAATGLGTLNARTNQSATTSRYTVTLAEWAAGLWAGKVGATLDFFNSSNTKLNTTGVMTIYQVDLDSRFIFVSGAAGDITAIDTYVAANADLGYIRWAGASGNEFAGIDKIVTNTGTLFGISAATYSDLWKGTSYSAASAALTFGKVIRGLSAAANRGLMEEATLYVNPLTWANLNDDLAALRRYPSNEKGKFVQGTEEIEYYTVTGKLRVVPHLFVKQGSAYAIPTKKCLRPGAVDLTFKTPGMNEQIFFHDPTTASYKIRLYTDQAFFCETPSRMVKFTGIVNS